MSLAYCVSISRSFPTHVLRGSSPANSLPVGCATDATWKLVWKNTAASGAATSTDREKRGLSLELPKPFLVRWQQSISASGRSLCLWFRDLRPTVNQSQVLSSKRSHHSKPITTCLCALNICLTLQLDQSYQTFSSFLEKISGCGIHY